ncbi:hypothetical protein ACHHYP_20318 [Achlya hypogyna]|uniref:Uncharacterized protein n=1 Tax=Achlya hypogyna TaxID=1202772 RepID=A0A1V9ZMQ9_ACHHY|nr:hypothetical protein ACHHYP_20318 [Achlya hypogyna]
MTGIEAGVVHGKIRRGVGIGRTQDCGGHDWGLVANGDFCLAAGATPSHVVFAAGDILSMVFDQGDSGHAGPGTPTLLLKSSVDVFISTILYINATPQADS